MTDKLSAAIPLRERQRLIMTYDAGEVHGAPPETAEGQLRSLVQCFEGTHVGILQRCVGYPGTAQATKVPGLEYRPHLRAWIEAGVDPMGIFVDECHRCGIQAWGSCRMNDAHHTYDGLDYSQSQYYKDHPELRQRSHGSHQISATYDWNKPQVAEQNMALLREVSETWDVDGLDLDYTRGSPYFNPDETEEGRETMTQYIRDVRTMLDEVGSKRGKRLGLSIEFYLHDSLYKQFEPAGSKDTNDIEINKSAGLDVQTWAREGLIDYLIGHCRSASLFELDISAWKQAVRGTNCRLAAGPGKPSRFKQPRSGSINGSAAGRTNHLQHRAIAHRLYEQGADDIFFYDFVVRSYELDWDMFRELGDIERVKRANKSYFYQMALPLEVGPAEGGGTAQMQIDIADNVPAILKSGTPVQARLLLNITKIRSAKDVRLKVNGQAMEVNPEPGITLPMSFTDHPEDHPPYHLQVNVDPSILKHGRNDLAFEVRPASYVPLHGDHKVEVRKVELALIYRDETYPQWLAVQMHHSM